MNYAESNEIFDFIVNRIISLRLEKKVSARDMSIALGQNPNYINKIERKLAKPSLDGLLYICEYFGFTYFEFFDKQLEYPLKVKELMEEAEELDEESLAQLIRLAKYFKKLKMINWKRNYRD